MDFRVELRKILFSAEKQGLSKIAVNSGDLHRQVGGYPGPNHRMPMCCSAMRAEMRHGDTIIQSPPSGKGSSLTIEYRLPGSFSNKTNESGHGKTDEKKKSGEKQGASEQKKPYTTPQEIYAYFNCPYPCDKNQLDKAYKKLIGQYHPDKVATMGPEIRKVAEEETKKINGMYDKAVSILGSNYGM